MLLIDEYTEVKLVEALESYRADSKMVRCIYFQFTGIDVIGGFKEKFIELSQHYFPTMSTHIYFCNDGDIFLLAPTIPAKEGKEFVLNIGKFLNRPVSDNWVCFYEAPLQINKLLTIVQQKLDYLHEIEEEKRKIQEQKRQEIKRQAILNSGGIGKAEDIERLRTTRKSPVLMLIEDDAFSRKLVENVLSKKYSLTSTGDASYALSTYARIAPNLLFLDINLPDVTGHELLEKIIKLDPGAYVIMLSGNCDKENIMQAMNKGAKGFVAKPFTKEKLFQYIDRCPTILGAFT